MPLSSRACLLLIAFAVPAVSVQAQAQEISERTNLYVTDGTADIPDDLLKRGSDFSLFAECAPRAERSAIVLGLLVSGFKFLLKEANKAITAKEKKYIASLSHTAAASLTAANFPVEAGASSPKCLVLDRVAFADKKPLGGSTYVYKLQPVGGRAFTIELVAVKVTHSTLLGRKGLPDILNADLALSFTTVQPGEAGRLEQIALPSYALSVEGIDHTRPAVRPSSEQKLSPVLPLPPKGSPTTIVATVTESNAALQKEEQRIALQQAVRGKILEYAGSLLDEAVK